MQPAGIGDFLDEVHDSYFAGGFRTSTQRVMRSFFSSRTVSIPSPAPKPGAAVPGGRTRAPGGGRSGGAPGTPGTPGVPGGGGILRGGRAGFTAPGAGATGTTGAGAPGTSAFSSIGLTSIAFTSRPLGDL